MIDELWKRLDEADDTIVRASGEDTYTGQQTGALLAIAKQLSVANKIALASLTEKTEEK